jgi:predicted nucleic acid-binding protein
MYAWCGERLSSSIGTSSSARGKSVEPSIVLIVVDASAIIAALADTGTARQAVADQRLHAPHLVDAEVVPAFSRAERGGRLSAARAAAPAIRTFSEMGVYRHSISGLLGRMWALRHNLSAYDAAYIALAEALDCPLLTADRRMVKAPNLPAAVTFCRQRPTQKRRLR